MKLAISSVGFGFVMIIVSMFILKNVADAEGYRRGFVQGRCVILHDLEHSLYSDQCAGIAYPEWLSKGGSE